MSLEQLQHQLRNADPQDEAAFHRLVNETMDALHLQDDDIARFLDMNLLSVHRWTDGRSAPHPAMRPHVYRKLLQLVDAAIPPPEEVVD